MTVPVKYSLLQGITRGEVCHLWHYEKGIRHYYYRLRLNIQEYDAIMEEKKKWSEKTQ